MKLQPKDPSTLIFSDENIDNSDLGEGEFYQQQQLTAIELEKLKGRQQDREERKKYAKHIFNFIWVWCLAVLAILVLIGLGWLKLSNSVIITLITTTTANILALFVIVANYLFFRPKNKGFVSV